MQNLSIRDGKLLTEEQLAHALDTSVQTPPPTAHKEDTIHPAWASLDPLGPPQGPQGAREGRSRGSGVNACGSQTTRSAGPHLPMTPSPDRRYQSKLWLRRRRKRQEAAELSKILRATSESLSAPFLLSSEANRTLNVGNGSETVMRVAAFHVRLWLEHLGLEMPPASTRSDNLNAVSNEARADLSRRK